MSQDTARLPELEQLILDAFDLAARDGRSDWYCMRATVLKNRLLDLTRRSFDESAYGADRFSELVASQTSMLTMDQSTSPYMVELREPYRSQVRRVARGGGSTARGRIRPDLWHAIVDYSSGDKWVWDRKLKRAVQVGEKKDTPSEDIFPTASRANFREWRAEFAREHAETLRDPEAAQLEEWASKGLGTQNLPLRLRNSWNTTMQQRVHDRLLGFFRDRDEDSPRNLIVEGQIQSTVDELRAFVIRCVALMTEQELKELSIPAAIALRAHR